jgi:predicted O-linked N-acetylglucosamine transferase (SPINDLY family)
MEDWIANNEKDYILKAVFHVSDLKKLFQTKKGLRNKFLKSPLSDAKQYAKNFENSINSMWKTYLENKI